MNISDEVDALYQYIIDNNIATEDEVNLISNINGYNIDSLESVLYARAGYRSLNQITESDA